MFLKIENWTSDFTSNRSKLKLNSFDCFEKRRKNYTHGKARKQVVKRLTIGHQILRQTGANWIHLKISEEKTTLTRKHANKRLKNYRKNYTFPMETDISQWAVGLLRCWARLLLTSVIFSVLYWLKKTRDSVRRRPPVSCQPPKIVTDQYWPVKNAIMEHLELEDLLNLKIAYP